MLLSPGSSVNDHIKVCFLDMNFEGIGFPELHTMPDLLATRTRVALAEGVCWRGGHGRHASTHPPPWEQGFALRGQREQRVHQSAMMLLLREEGETS